MRPMALIVALCALALPPQQQPPPTEVFLMDLSTAATAPRWMNVSNNPGYDNQPSFLPDSSAMLFSSNRDGKQTDIYRYEIASKALTQLTKTTEQEYSPLVTPDGKGFSVIRVEADGAQRLWRFDLDGSNPRLVLENVKPVGYHAWIDATHLALFVLGSPASPGNTLQIADTATGKAEVIETGIGRSILIRRPGIVSYMSTASPRMIKLLDAKTRAITPFLAPLEGSQDAAWRDGGKTLLMASGTTISSASEGASGWTPLVELKTDPQDSSRQPVTGITRMALSPNGRWLAFVAEIRVQ